MGLAPLSAVKTLFYSFERKKKARNQLKGVIRQLYSQDLNK